MNERMYKTKK